MRIENKILSDVTVHMKYAKYLDQEQRRESWEDLTNRNMKMNISKFPEEEERIREAYKFVLRREVLPSMRSMQFAGKSIETNPARIFNCAYAPADDPRIFSEIMFLLLGGTGVGYSVQKHHVEKLPVIRKPSSKSSRRFLVGDSIEGWADSIKALVMSYFKGTSRLRFDFSDVREKGARLVTSGGKAPGSDPLRICLESIERLLETKSAGEYLAPIEVHDMICIIADAVLAGGIRRAALISLFSTTDEVMMNSKSNFKVLSWSNISTPGPLNVSGEKTSVNLEHVDPQGKKYFDIDVKYIDSAYGEKSVRLNWVSEHDIETHLKPKSSLPWFYFHPHRGRANNTTVILRHRVTKDSFFSIWDKIKASGAGEPGFYLSNDKEWGVNPCCEISLRPFQFCNLVEVNVSDIKDQDDYNERVSVASYIATLQASYTDFHYLRPIWQRTTEKDALIGVSMTGIASGKVLALDMKQAAKLVNEVNAETALRIGINKAARTTCVKPAGTTSLVLGTSSGVHAWHNKFYIRRIRVGKNEAIYKYLLNKLPELVEDDFFRAHDTAIISIPQRAPEGAILRHESAIDLLERVKMISKEWILEGHGDGSNSHNVSATVSIKDEDWEEVGNWMWENKEYYNGLSVLPHDGGTYVQAPFEDCSEEKYSSMLEFVKFINLDEVIESEDNTDLQGEIACAGGACELK